MICRGHLGEIIEEGLGDGRRFGLSIAYSDEGPVPIGTAGALRRALPLLGDRFLVMYGDTYLRVDYPAVAAAHADSGLPGLMTVLRNDGRWGPSNATYARGRVTAYDKRDPPAGCGLDRLWPSRAHPRRSRGGRRERSCRRAQSVGAGRGARGTAGAQTLL